MTFNKGKDIMSAMLHILGLGLAIAGTVLLIIKGCAYSPWHVVSYSIFGASMIALYAASSVYHTFFISERVHTTLRRIDTHGQCIKNNSTHDNSKIDHCHIMCIIC